MAPPDLCFHLSMRQGQGGILLVSPRTFRLMSADPSRLHLSDIPLPLPNSSHTTNTPMISCRHRPCSTTWCQYTESRSFNTCSSEAGALPLPLDITICNARRSPSTKKCLSIHQEAMKVPSQIQLLPNLQPSLQSIDGSRKRTSAMLSSLKKFQRTFPLDTMEKLTAFPIG